MDVFIAILSLSMRSIQVLVIGVALQSNTLTDKELLNMQYVLSGVSAGSFERDTAGINQ